jgi:hypothetical protein
MAMVGIAVHGIAAVIDMSTVAMAAATTAAIDRHYATAQAVRSSSLPGEGLFCENP